VDFPRRKRLPHETPLGLLPEEAMFFITICAADRGSDDLLRDGRAAGLLEAVRYRQTNGIWWCRAFVVMPDHVHGLIRFPSPEHPLQREMRELKKYTARMLGIGWQKDFFDHRLRREESEREKADYILRNPERAGLVEDWREWPHFFVAADGV
jgi:REP element-mobilizing transposase RayT